MTSPRDTASAAPTSSKNRLVGMKSRGAIRNSRWQRCLSPAHRELERLTVDRETAHLQQTLAVRYAELVYNGVWFSTQRQALDGFFNVSQQRVTGSVGLKLWKGTLNVTSRKSPFSLYRADLASFHHGPLQPQGRRRLHQSLRASSHRSPQRQSRRQQFVTLLRLLIVTLRTSDKDVLEDLQPAMRARSGRMTERKDSKLWGGRFERAPDARFDAFISVPSRSIAASCRRKSR